MGISDYFRFKSESPVDPLKRAFEIAPFYAWSWHCNIAMAFFDEGGTHEQANRAAARFMKIAFDIDMTTYDEWKTFEKIWLETKEKEGCGTGS